MVHNAATGEAFLLDSTVLQSPRFLNQERCLQMRCDIPVNSAMMALAGGSLQQWVDQCRLVVFHPEYRGQAVCDFSAQNYEFHLSRDIARDREHAVASAALDKAGLPANPTPAQLQAYLDSVLNIIPQGFSETQVQEARKKLEALGSGIVPVLARRLAVADGVEKNIVVPVLRSLARAEHLPELQTVLRLDPDPELVQLFWEKKWTAAAQSALKPWLKQRQRVLPWKAVAMLTEERDPATYPDLTWHFAYNRAEHRQMLVELERCPGFDLASAITLAWKRARLEYAAKSGLCLAAAAEGWTDALPVAIAQFADMRDAPQRKEFGQNLARLTQYTGEPDALESWLLKNGRDFQFDAGTKRYLLP